jgi:serine/threonine protein kinase
MVLFLTRLQQEAEVLARVGIHPNILQLYGFDLPGNDGGDGPIFNKQDRRPPLVLELMDTTLSTVLHGHADGGVDQSPPPSAAAMVGWMKGIASALEFLHLQGIVHGNIKSRNVLLSRDRAVAKLSDFGEAKEKGMRSTTVLFDPSSTLPTAFATAADSVGQQHGGGAVPYHAPEILVGKLVGPSRKADVYAFGVVLWECATRKVPCKGQRDYDIIRRALDESKPYLLDMPQNLSPLWYANRDELDGQDDARRLLQLAQSCMHRSPQLRPDATSLIQQFQLQEEIVDDNFESLLVIDDHDEVAIKGDDFESLVVINVPKVSIKGDEVAVAFHDEELASKPAAASSSSKTNGCVKSRRRCCFWTAVAMLLPFIVAAIGFGYCRLDCFK